jgi:hypothetical protein
MWHHCFLLVCITPCHLPCSHLDKSYMIYAKPCDTSCHLWVCWYGTTIVCMLHSNSKALESWCVHSINYPHYSKVHTARVKLGLSFWLESTFVVSWSNNGLTAWLTYRYGGIGKMGWAVPSPYGCLRPQMGIQHLDVSCVLTTKNLIWTVCGVLIPLWLERPLWKRLQYGRHLVKLHGIVICILWKVRQEPSLP